jgi:biopolymer transport protein ExbB
MEPSTLLPVLLREGGPIMPLILAAALAGSLLACERLLVWVSWVRRDRSLRRAPDAGTLAEALRALPPAPSTPLADLLRGAAPLASLSPERREPALQALLLTRLPAVEARISTIGWLGTILPMLGLLGTVSGMITTFHDLALTTSRQVLSQGLAEALWTTEVGLVTALPLLAVHHALSRLKQRWLNGLERALALLLAGAAGVSPAPSSAPSPIATPGGDHEP